MNKIERFVIAIGFLFFIPTVYFIYRGMYTWLGIFISTLPLFPCAVIFVLSLHFRKMTKQNAVKIIAEAKNEAQKIIEEAKIEIEKEKKRLKAKEKELEEREKQAKANIEEHKRQMLCYSNALNVKNKLLKKIKQIAYAKDRKPENIVEEIKKRTYEL